MIKRFAAALGVIVFLVVAGTSVSYAYWTATAGMTATVQIANPAVSNCSNIVALTNGGFETPQLSDNSWSSTTTPTGWTSRAPGTNTARGFEMWRGSVVSPILPAAGAQNLELNSDNPTTTYQQVATTPGQVLRYGFWHRGRDSATVGDVVKLTIGAPTTNAADASATTSTGAVLAQLYTTTSTAWAYYSGSYTVPAGQTTTRLSLTSVSVGGGNQTQGNLIDDVTFGTGPCVTATSTVSNVTTGGTTYRVGDTVRFVTTIANSGGAVAAASVAKVVLPTNLTLVSGSIRIGTAAQTNATGDDLGEYVSGTRTVIARIGAGATTGLGGRVSNASPLTVSYDAVIGTGTTITHTPAVDFVDEAVPSWTLTVTGATLTRTVEAGADLAVAVLATPVVAPGSVTWSFRITNTGPQNATGVTVALTLPNGVTYGSGAVRQTTTNGGTTTTATGCSRSGTTGSCTIGALPAGEGRTVTVTATIPASPANSYTVTAVVSSTSIDPNTSNNSATNTATAPVAVPAPQSFSARRDAVDNIYLTWSAPSGATGVTGYRIYRNGGTTPIGTVNQYTFNFSDTGATPSTANWYTIVAVDAVGNLSPSSGVGVFTYRDDGTEYRIGYPASSPARCVGGEGGGDGAALRVQNCSNSGNQWFTFTSGSYNSAHLVPVTGDDRRWSTNGSETAGAAAVLQDASWWGGYPWWNNDSRYRWDLGVVKDASTGALYVTFENRDSGLCLAASAAAGANGTALVQTTCDPNAAAQRFTAAE